MNKKIVFAGPVGTRSGYGARSRDICKSLIKLGYDLKIVDTPWGTTPTDALDPNNDSDVELLKRFHQGAITEQPDVFIHCVIPNEFQKVGKFNIGITAGIETDTCQPEWIEGCNRMDLVLTSSNHSKKVFQEIEFEKRDKQTNQVVAKIRCTTPVEVLFEGVDTSVYLKLPESKLEPAIKQYLDSIPESFAFLFVGHWLQGDLGHDRKDVGMLVKTFLGTFNKTKQMPALILKTSSAGFSVPERFSIQDRIQQIQMTFRDQGHTGKLPPIYLLYGDFTDSEMNSLYNHPKVKAMLSFTKGEGFGRPLLEFTTTGKPIIASNWSGQTDFLKPEYSYLLPGGVNKVHPSAVNNWIMQDSKWFTVNYSFASQVLNNCYVSYQAAVTRCKKQKDHTLSNFTMEHMQDKIKYFIDDLENLKGQNTNPIENKLTLPKRN